MYFFLGTWHDHLAAAPIGFTRAAGNFEAVDGDAVIGQSMDGANTNNGLSTALGIRLGNGIGTFQAPLEFGGRGDAPADFNGDGWLDFADVDLGGISVMLNDRHW